MPNNVFKVTLHPDETVWGATISLEELGPFLADPKRWLGTVISERAGRDAPLLVHTTGADDSDEIKLSGMEETSNVCLKIGGRALAVGGTGFLEDLRTTSSTSALDEEIARASDKASVVTYAIPSYGEVCVMVPLGPDSFLTFQLVETLRREAVLVQWFNETALPKSSLLVADDGSRHETAPDSVKLVSSEGQSSAVDLPARVEPLTDDHRLAGFDQTVLTVQATIVGKDDGSGAVLCQPYALNLEPAQSS
ncbi:MAG: hypothetical protein JST30_10865 [Armatimonadetes bacterium]|nr:hypothetical protein [Armatimonadota bacterium]